MPIRSIDDVVERYRENWHGYVRQFRVLLVVTLLAALADAVSTVYFMLVEGPQAETHPAVRFMAGLLGPVLGPLAGKACQFFVVIGLTVYLRRHALYIFVAVIILYTWAAWFNIWGRDFYYPRLLYWLDLLSL
jgi:hypothetical protein